MTEITLDIPTLTTERLTLRAPRAADIDAYAAFYASERSHIIGGPKTSKEAWKTLTNDAGHWMLRGFGWWSVDDETGCVGSVGFHLPEGETDVELGWSLFSATGKGYATEAAQAALDWAGDRWPRIVSHIDRRNLPSQKVATRLGAKDSGASTAHNPDCNVWVHEVTA